MTIQPAEPVFAPARPRPRSQTRHLAPVPAPSPDPASETAQAAIQTAPVTGFDVERFGCAGYNAAGLPIVPKATAIAAGLLPLSALARFVGKTPGTVKRWVDEGTAPGPVAVQQAQTGGGHHRLLFSAEEYANHANGGRQRSRPPVRVGLRTSGAAGPYRWRDPARWAPDTTPQTQRTHQSRPVREATARPGARP